MAKIKPLTGNFGDFSGIVLKAAAGGNIPAVRHYLKKNPQWLNQAGPHGRTLLWEAVYKGRTKLVAELIRRGASVNPVGCYFTPMRVDLTALAVARAAGRAELVELLLEHGAEDDLYAACHRGDIDAVKQFLKSDRKAVNRPMFAETHPRAGSHPLHYAVAGQQPAMVEFLIERGAQVAPHWELLKDWADGHRQMIRALKKRSEAEAPGSTKTSRRRTRLRKIDEPDWLGFPPLVDACRGNHNATDDPQRVQILLGQGADINVTDHKQKTALHRSAQAGFVKITRLLIERGANLEATDLKMMTPIYDAIYHGRIEALELLIEQGANLKHQDERGETPLFMAARRGYLDCFQLLKSAGSALDHCNHKGQSLAKIIAQHRHQTPERKVMLKLL